MDPLRDLLRKECQWKWTINHRQAFNELKNNFVKITQLYHYDLNREFKLQTDASDRGISGILYQTDDDNKPKLIAVVSRCLQAAEVNYNTTEKELLAIVYSLNKFRVFLLNRKFKIITDHQALTFLNNSPFHTARLARWSLLVQKYQFDIEHCRGVDNQIADFFSRNPEGKFVYPQSKNLIISTLMPFREEYQIKIGVTNSINYLKISPDKKYLLKNLAQLQQQDTDLVQFLNNKSQTVGSDNYQCHQGIWFHRPHGQEGWKVVVPKAIQEELVRHEHDSLCHAAVYKTMCRIKRNFWFKYLEQVVKRVISRCDICQRVKHLNICVDGDYGNVTSTKPRELVTVDFYGPLPMSVGKVQYIFVVIDAFTKYVKLYPVVKAHTDTVLRKISVNYVDDAGGKPEKILADNGTQFTSRRWRNDLEAAGIRVKFCSIRHPQSNPTERVMRELGRMFRVLCSTQHNTWSKHLKTIEACLNCATHHGTGCIPHELQFGTEVPDPMRDLIPYPIQLPLDFNKIVVQAVKKLSKGFDNRKRNQRNHHPYIYKIDDLVLIRVPHLSNQSDKVIHKFFHLYEGPYKIGRIISNNAFVLSDVDTEVELRGTYNRNCLRPYRK